MPRLRASLSSLTLLIGTLAVEPNALAQPFAYVSNQMMNNVAVVNLGTNSVVTLISYSAGGLSGLAVTPDGSLLYVAAQSANAVVVMSTSSNSVVGTIPVGNAPTHVAITPNGQMAYVSNQNDGTVTAINIPANTVAATIQVGPIPGGLAVTPDGTELLVTNAGSASVGGTISVISTATNSMTTSWEMGNGANDIAITQDGTLAYVTNQNQSALMTYRVADGSLVTTVNGLGSPTWVALSPDGSSAYVTNGNGACMYVIDNSRAQVVNSVGVGLLPTSVAVTPDGSTLYVTNGFGFSLSEIATSGLNTLNTLAEVGIYPYQIVLAPSGPTSIAKSGGDGQSVMVDQTFPTALRVTVTNASGSPVKGAPVTFSVVPGGNGAGASFASSPQMPILTDVNGYATAPALTANDTAGSFTVMATANNLAAVFGLTNNGGTPAAGAGPGALSFTPLQKPGTASAPQTVTLSNTGSGPLTISSVTTTGVNATDFGIQSTTCGGSLAQQSNCTIGVIFKPASNGPKSAALTIASNDPLNPAINVGLSGLGPIAPVAGSVNGGFGTSAVFTANFSDANGGTDIVNARILISATGGAANACYVEYSAGKLYLMNDAGSGWLGGFAPGSGSAVSNSQCVLNSIGSGFSAASYPGTAASLTANLTFTLPKFTGMKNVYIYAIDSTSLNTGVTLEGTWDVGNPGAFVNPASLTYATRLIGSATAAQKVTLSYAGASPLSIDSIAFTGTNPGDFGLSSTTCGATLNPGSSCVMSVDFDPTAGGPRSAALTITSNDGVNPVLNVSLSGMGAVAPTVGVLSPSSGSGSSVTFTATFSDIDGGNDISYARILVNASANPVNGCYVEYSAGKLYLMNDQATTWQGGFAPGSATSVSNSHCTLNGVGSSYSAASYPGTSATLTMNINFITPAFSGSKNVFLIAGDALGLKSGMVAKGKWTVQ